MKEYAKVVWSPEDVQTHRPNWTLEQCAAWLEDNQKHIRDRLVELGHGIIAELLDEAD